MIEKMLKTFIICRAEDKNSSLKTLKELGIIHVEQSVKPDSMEITELQQTISKTTSILNILSEYAKKNSRTTSSQLSAKEIATTAIQNIAELNELKNELKATYIEQEKLLPWGNFSFSSIEKLKQAGLFVYLCQVLPANLDFYKHLGIIKIINETKHNIYFALICEKEYQKSDLPIASMPQNNVSLNEINSRISELQNKVETTEKKIIEIANNINEIKKYISSLEEELEFVTNASGMGNTNNLSYLKGYIPENHKNKLSETAKTNGWAILYQIPTEEDRTPTLIKTPKIFTMAKPIFDFINIYPGYYELDVSICFLIFLSTFFGIILGDAGYGFIFLAITIFLKFKLKHKKNFQPALNLFIILSITTSIWGLLTCSIFELPEELLPKFIQNCKLNALTNPNVRNANIQWLCFFLAALHLSTARIWKAFANRSSLKALGQLGWALFIWGNFFILVKLIIKTNQPTPQITFYLYSIGIFLILAFYVKWNDVGSIFNTPFHIIGSFVDVLSYIRLFAVNLASIYLILCFNNMVSMLIHLSPWLIIAGIILLILVHFLNIALGFMAVLVHGVRLNTLEFSNQMELEWSGIKYKPFKEYTLESSYNLTFGFKNPD